MFYFIAEWFCNGGKIKPTAELYKHLSKRDIHLGEGLGFLDTKKGTALDLVEEELQIDQNDIIDFIRSIPAYRQYLNNLLKEYQ